GQGVGAVVLGGVGLDALGEVGRLVGGEARQHRLVEVGVGALGDQVDLDLRLARVELVGERLQLGLQVAAQRVPEGDLDGGLEGAQLGRGSAAATAGGDQQDGQQAQG